MPMRPALLRLILLTSVALLSSAFSAPAPAGAGGTVGWPEWGQNPLHQGNVTTVGQDPASVLADVVYDPFTAAEEASNDGELLVHYQVPLVDGNDVFMEFKTGSFTTNNTWNTQI